MKVLFLDHNSVLSDIKKHFKPVTTLVEAEAVVVWSDLTHFERGVVEVANRMGLPTYVIQHGRRGSSRYYPPFNEKITADKLLVWGQADKDALIEAGHSEAKIEVIGCPILSHFHKKKHRGTNIVFSPEHWDYDVEENTRIAKELKGLVTTTKIIESHDESKYENVVKSNRDDPNHLKICADVLSTADLVVGVSESTFELMAQYLDIPVVIVDEWTPKPFGGDWRYKTGYRRLVSRASKTTTVKNLRQTIKEQLANPQELKQERLAVCLEEGGINLNAIEQIKSIISK